MSTGKLASGQIRGTNVGFHGNPNHDRHQRADAECQEGCGNRWPILTARPFDVNFVEQVYLNIQQMEVQLC